MTNPRTRTRCGVGRAWVLSALICGLVAACGNDGGADAATDSGEATVDGGEWWAVDGGASDDDTTASSGSDASKGGELDPVCYDSCIKKGQPKSVCEPACTGSGKGGDVDKACYDSCIKKGLSEKACQGYCPAGGGATEVDKTCYDGCIKKGESKETCTKACPATGKQETCYDSCVSKGDSPGVCKTACTCYNGCLKGGKDSATCGDQCFSGGGGGETYKQPCYDDCLKKGESKETCAKACPAAALKPDWATVHAQIVKPTCAGGYCHGGGSGSLKLTGDATADYQALTTGKAGGKDAASCGAGAYVVAGKPGESLLWLKVDAKADHGCGKKMPSGTTGLSDQLSELVKGWITAGAKP